MEQPTCPSSVEPPTCPSSVEPVNKEKTVTDYVSASDYEGLVSNFSNFDVNTIDHRGNSLLHIAALRGNVQIVNLLLEKGATVDRLDTASHTPLHFAANEGNFEVLKVLVEHGAVVSAQNKDMRIDLKGIPIYAPGGKTPLHFAAEHGYDDCVEYLLQKGADMNVRDSDGYTPMDMAHFNSNESTLLLLDPDSKYVKPEPMTSEERFLQDHKKRAQRMGKVETKLQANPVPHQSYTPLHPDLFCLHEHFFDPDFLAAVKSNTESSLRSVLEEVTPRVFIFKMFNEEFCSKMIEEIKNFEKSGLPITRPNSMNRYGAVLDEIGFGTMMDNLMQKYICPFARILFADAGGDELNDRRAFVVQYKLGEDVNLKSHVDSSAVTLNVCLGKEFTGGNLLFQGIKGTDSENVENFEYAHVPGKGLLHLGKHIHQANNIVSGERYNLIVWCRKKM